MTRTYPPAASARAQWDAEINKMTGWGAKVSDQDRSALLDYLAARYGPVAG